MSPVGVTNSGMHFGKIHSRVRVGGSARFWSGVIKEYRAGGRRFSANPVSMPLRATFLMACDHRRAPTHRKLPNSTSAMLYCQAEHPMASIFGA